jgi:hypothetical protein
VEGGAVEFDSQPQLRPGHIQDVPRTVDDNHELPVLPGQARMLEVFVVRKSPARCAPRTQLLGQLDELTSAAQERPLLGNPADVLGRNPPVPYRCDDQVSTMSPVQDRPTVDDSGSGPYRG